MCNIGIFLCTIWALGDWVSWIKKKRKSWRVFFLLFRWRHHQTCLSNVKSRQNFWLFLFFFPLFLSNCLVIHFFSLNSWAKLIPLWDGDANSTCYSCSKMRFATSNNNKERMEFPFFCLSIFPYESKELSHYCISCSLAPLSLQ